MTEQIIITGRSSSHFTRVVRIFAFELKVDYAFHIARDLTSVDVDNYAGNPALKVPVLHNVRGTWFGALPICRELQRQSTHELKIIWPDSVADNMQCNAQELILQAMATEVSLIMSTLSGATEPAQQKMKSSLHNMLSWLDVNASHVLMLPARDISFLEVTLFCLMRHLEFRKLLDTRSYSHLFAFCEQFAQRTSAIATDFKYD